MIKWHVQSDQLKLLLEGTRKTITRIDKKKIKPGSTMILACWGKKLMVEVDRVEYKKYSEFDESAARLEGFETLEEFQEEQFIAYGRRVREDTLFTVVTFHLRG